MSVSVPGGGSGSGTDSPSVAEATDAGLTRRSTRWAPEAEAVLTPGVQAYTKGSGQCTTNFVFTDAEGAVYLGQSAHCAGTGDSSETDGCRTGSAPLGTEVTFREHGTPLDSGERLGTGVLVYSSWVSMQENGETDSATCAYNDFALIKVSAGDVEKVNPTIPSWGGPVGIDVDGVAAGETVYSYGNSSLRLGITEFSPQHGTAQADDLAAKGWSHSLSSPTPGVPGDSGSAYLGPDGKAIGTLSTLGLSLPVTNSIGDLAHELRYARKHSGIEGLALELGTAPFSG